MTGDSNFQLFFEESPDVLLVLLPDSPRFTAVAATKARLAATHSTLEQTVGRGLFELFPENPDDPEAHATANLRASLERVLATKAADTMAVQKYDIPRPDGGFEIKYWSPRNIPILSVTGEVIYILHRAVDVTDLTRASVEGRELRGRTEDMERDVLQRSRELDAANRSLREANEKLNDLDSAKSAFFSNISHEFRTPLTLMLGPLEDGLNDERRPLGDVQRNRLTLAHDNALRLMKLVNALLDFSRLEAGRLHGNFAPTDIAALTRDLAGMFQTAFDKAGLRLAIECTTPQILYVDTEMWEKIVPNLVSNAFKFTMTGAVTVRLTSNESQAQLEVADTGVGIPEGDLPQVFDRFHRVAGAVGRTHEGTGIGLALVRELVQLHGGTVEVESRLGFGSVFRVKIPTGFVHLPKDSVRHQPASTAASTASNAHSIEASRWIATPAEPHAADEVRPFRANERRLPVVVVADDNADLRAYISGLLEEEYQVLTAGDGVEALDLIRNELPDLVLSDVMMPHMTGIELVQELRADPSTVAIPVILLSARAGEGAALEGRDAGSDDYVTKPFTAHELLARVRSQLKLAQARRRWTAELELANRELDAFSYSVAHDLRGPLRAIDGFSQMLQEDSHQLDGRGQQRLGIIRASALRMSQLIEDLLALAKVSRSDVRRIPFELSCLVRTVFGQLQEAAGDRHVTLTVQEGVFVNADPHLLQIVLDNLLRNAWKFTAKHPHAQIQFGAEQSAGEVCYFIRDNGVGFDMNYSAKLFNVFQRLHSDTEYEGTGVGLATVKRVVGRHEGRVWAQGEVGRGATFYFTLNRRSSHFGTSTISDDLPSIQAKPKPPDQ